MSQSATVHSKLDTNALNAAFEALKTYGPGSSRAALLPMDEAIVACLDDNSARKGLERRLVTALNSGGSDVAREYICSKLILIGTARCVSALAARLNIPELATAARNALEAIPDRQASEAVRDSLPKVEGLQKLGVINSLGARRDAQSIRALTTLLGNADAAIAGAAAGALGDIATAKAGKALCKFLPNAPEAIREKAADACLNCAERLMATGRRADARALYRLIATATQPNHVQQAATRGLELTAKLR